METSGGQVCPVCGDTDVVLDAGHYYCTTCGTQSQFFLEQVLEDDYTTGGQQTVIKPSKPSAGSSTSGEVGSRVCDWTTWEAFSWILKSYAEIMVGEGAPKELPAVAFGIWAKYLQESEVAFVSTSTSEVVDPKFSFKQRQRDVSAVLNLPVARKSRKRPRTSDTDMSESDSEMFSRTRRSRRRTLLKMYESHMSDTSGAESDTTDASELDVPTREVEMTEKAKGIHKAVASVKEEKTDRAEINEKLREKGVSTRMLKRGSVEHATLKTVFAVLNLSLAQLQSTLLSCDLIRYALEGRLPLKAHQLLPEHMEMKPKDVLVLRATSLGCQELRRESIRIHQFASLGTIKPRDLDAVSRRVVHSLRLPSELAKYVKRLVLWCLPDFDQVWDGPIMYEVSLHALCPEAFVASYLIVALKILVGLDGKCEYRLSQAARKLNKEKSGTVHFEWGKWVRFTEARCAFLREECHPYHSKVGEAGSGCREQVASAYVCGEALRQSQEASAEAVFPGCSEALRSNIKDLGGLDGADQVQPYDSSDVLDQWLKRLASDQPTYTPNRSILTTDFSCHSLDMFLNPQRYVAKLKGTKWAVEGPIHSAVWTWKESRDVRDITRELPRSYLWLVRRAAECVSMSPADLYEGFVVPAEKRCQQTCRKKR